MSAKLKYEVIAVTGKYKDKEGNEKSKWLKCGVVLQTDKGFSLKLEAIPIGSDGWFSLREPQKKESSQSAQRPTEPEFDDDLPW